MTVVINGTTGITSPEMAVDNGAADGGQVVLKSSGFNNWNIDNYSGNCRFYYNATELMRIDSSGNVGIGAAPLGWSGSKSLTLLTPSGSVYTSLFTVGNTVGLTSNAYYDGTNWKYGINYNAQQYYMGDGSHVWRTASASTGTISWSESMRIDSSGNLLVGNTNAGAAPAQGIQIRGAVSNSYISIGHASGTGSGNWFADFNYNSTVIGTISQNGTTGVLYNLTSDYRLKNDPQPLTGAKDFVMALQPKKWQWWDGSGEGVGFIAHEFMEVAKHSGNGEKDAVDADGNPVYQSIQPSSSEVMANLVSLLQEQQAIITQLQADVAALKGNA